MTTEHDFESEKFDAYAESYERHHAASVTLSGERPPYFHEYKIARLQRHGVGAGDVALDYGCGVGNLMERLKPIVSRMSGFDPSLKSLEACRKRVPNADYYSQPSDIPSASFDISVLSGVLHHVPVDERPSIMAHVFSCLKPGGRVFIFEHNPLNPYTRRVIRECAFDDGAIPLMSSEIIKLLRMSGFSQVQREYIVFFPRFLSYLRPIEPKLSWCPLGAQTLTIGVRPKAG